MAVERREPLPAGRYWIYILEDELEDWDEWAEDNALTVHVVASERKTKLPSHAPAVMVTRPDLSIIMEAAGAWFLFDVLSPTPWVGFGFPTIVTDRSISQSIHVEQAPDPVPDDQLGMDLWGELKGLVLLGGGIFLAGALLMRGRR